MDWMVKWSAAAYAALLPFAQFSAAVGFVVALPVGLSFKRMSGYSAGVCFIASYVVAAVTWLLGVTLTLSSMGWIGFLIGLLIAGVGFVPLGLIGALFLIEEGGSMAWSLVAMIVTVILLRLSAAWMLGRSED